MTMIDIESMYLLEDGKEILPKKYLSAISITRRTIIQT